jgi:hypothetical protein
LSEKRSEIIFFERDGSRRWLPRFPLPKVMMASNIARKLHETSGLQIPGRGAGARRRARFMTRYGSEKK